MARISGNDKLSSAKMDVPHKHKNPLVNNSEVFDFAHLLISIVISDDRSADPGQPEHRGPEGCPDRGERPAQTDTDPGDRTGVTEEPGEKHSVSTHFIYLNTCLS